MKCDIFVWLLSCSMTFWVCHISTLLYISTYQYIIKAHITNWFFFTANPLLYGYIVIGLSIHSLMETWVCFPSFGCVNSAAMSIHVQVFIWVSIFNSFECIRKSELLDHMLILCLMFWEPPNCFPSLWKQWLHCFYSQTRNAGGFWFFYNLANTCYFPFLKVITILEGYEVLSHCIFWFAFIMV